MTDSTQNDAELSIFEDDNSDSTDEGTAGGSTASDNSTKPDLGAINRERQIKVWADRVEKGEVTLDELPKNLGWLKPFVNDEVGRRARAQDIDALVEQKLAERQAKEAKAKAEARFAELKAKAANLDVDQSTKDLIELSFARLVRKGLSKADALEEALSTYEVVAKSGDEALNQLKKAMKIPTVTTNAKSTEPEYGSEDFFKTGDSKSRVEKMEALLKNAGRQ